MIYKQVFDTATYKENCSRYIIKPDNTALLQICKQIRHEALPYCNCWTHLTWSLPV